MHTCIDVHAHWQVLGDNLLGHWPGSEACGICISQMCSIHASLSLPMHCGCAVFSSLHSGPCKWSFVLCMDNITDWSLNNLWCILFLTSALSGARLFDLTWLDVLAPARALLDFSRTCWGDVTITIQFTRSLCIQLLYMYSYIYCKYVSTLILSYSILQHIW